MRNNEALEKILGINLPCVKIKDIHWKTQDSTSESLLFYKFTGIEKNDAQFEDRIRKASFAFLIVNRSRENLPSNSIIIPEENWPKVQKEILDLLYPIPPLKILAVTGTNGKTTTTDLVLQLGTLIGKKGLSVGTLGVREYQKDLLDFGQTSPSFIDLRKFLNIYGQGKDFCVLEASSHALVQERLYGLKFSAAGWPSFSQDHLDYHQTMEDYFKAKTLIFNQLESEGNLFVPNEQKELLIRLMNVDPRVLETKTFSGEMPLFLKTTFNRNNLEVALEMIEKAFGVYPREKVKDLVSPEGRFYIRPYKSNYIVVDFAHTPDAVVNICKGIKETFPNHKLKVLFGCGGDRDRTKRPLMGKAAEIYADFVYVTSDNPRSENPDQIIDDIEKGFEKNNFVRITSRPEAVKKAFSDLKENEVLLLAGKGHEDYILISGVKHPYSDIEEVEKFLRG